MNSRSSIVKLARTLGLPALAWLGVAMASAAERPIDFSRDVRPILSAKCFACHGPDENTRQAGLRLDDRAGALSPAESGTPAIVPGQPQASGLVARINATDPAEQMPPTDSGKQLTAAERELLVRWIAAGAEYRGHWSFTTPVRSEPPAVRAESWVRNPVDRFILARLEAAGLSPAPEAERVTLIRRLTLDLTGLSPTPAEVDAWLADTRPDAYEQLVERLLASPHFGERMALDWLDAARFADTHGYHIDSGRDMTRWREWVIEAFNRNLPFDEFTVDQLAGDLLPGATVEQKIASGFHRNHMINFEGGAIPEEYLNAYIVDRVNTTGTVWLGLTVGCAQCHEHKYDPISQEEYYRLYAFFNQVPERGLDGSKGNAAPLLPAPTVDEQARLDELAAQIAAAEQALAAPLADEPAAQAAWEAELAGVHQETWTPAIPESYSSQGSATLERFEDGSLLAGGANPAQDVVEVTVPLAALRLTGVRIEALPDDRIGTGGLGRSENGNFVLTGFEAELLPPGDAAPQPLAWAAAEADYSQPMYDVTGAIDSDPATGWAIFGGPADSGRTSQFYPAPPGEIAPGTRLRLRLRFESRFAQHVIGRLRIATTGLSYPRMAEQPPEHLRAVLRTPAERRFPPLAAAVAQFFREHVSPVRRQARDELAALQRARQELGESVRTVMVMEDGATPRETFVLMRGQYDKPGPAVTPGTPAFLPPWDPQLPQNRWGLARWLVDPAHPLMPRVIANRYWQLVFGIGLVKTVEDLGSQGEPPSHPELLDWLAREFVDTGWDVKRLIRLLVTSSTYRQSSRIDPEHQGVDPENRLLSRASRLRLPAELIRDQALAAGGLLDDRIGGASVSPYQPLGLWEELASRLDGANWTAQTYTQSHGRDLYRRTMYTFWKRTSPPPSLITFDAPDRETCTVRRARTNTPLQALVLMNDPTYVEAARKLAERLLREAGPGSQERVAWAMRLTLGRLPTERELAVLLRLFETQLADFQAQPERALELLAVGEAPRDEALDPAQLAAWTMVASTLFNLDEFVTRG